ncbi:transmembrane protein, putative, partial [Bodo saltans]
MNDNEWEAYRADRSQLFQERIREEDIDIDEGGNEGATENVGGQQQQQHAIRTPVKTARSTDDDFEIAFEDDEDGGEEGNGKEGTFSILTLTGDRIAASKDDGGQNHVKTHRDGETKKEKKLRRKSEAEATVAAKAGGKGGSAYGFGELDNFVLFHDDYASFQNRGHQLRLEQYADEHAKDTLVAVTSSAAQSTPDQDHEKSTHPPTGDNAEGDEEDQRTLTSSCVSIEVDDDDDGNNGGGIFALGPLAGGGGIDGDERDDDEVSISDPRILRTLHYPYIVILLAVIAIDLWVIVGWYRNEASVCSSWIFTLWWITWLVDAVVCETLYLLSVMLFRYLIREPHEEDIHGRARRYFDGVGGKRDLRWWRGNLLHP